MTTVILSLDSLKLISRFAGPGGDGPDLSRSPANRDREDLAANVGSGDKPKLFYGIYVPHSPSFSLDKNESKVFTDRDEALRILKANKTARFKAFTCENEAREFSANGWVQHLRMFCWCLILKHNGKQTWVGTLASYLLNHQILKRLKWILNFSRLK